MDCSGSAVVNAMLVKKEEDKKGVKKQWMDLKKGFENNAHSFPRERELWPREGRWKFAERVHKKQTMYFQEVKHCIWY